MKRLPFVPLSFLTGFATLAFGYDVTVDVNASQPGASVAPSMYGIFFEEINHGAEGGLYGELIQNRSFEESLPIEGCTQVGENSRPEPMEHYALGKDKDWQARWSFPTPWPAWNIENQNAVGTLAISTNDPVHPANVNHLVVTVPALPPGSEVRVLNEGFWGIGVKAGAKYRLSFFARAAKGLEAGVEVGLLGADGKFQSLEKVPGPFSNHWKKYETTLTAAGSDPKCRLVLRPLSPGELHLDVVSLFPVDTYKGRPNGTRRDIAEKIAGLKPAFMRFPGGCYVEGATWANRYRWKETIGPIEARPGHWCLWGYRSSDGMGYHEFLQFCEDVGCAAMYVANVGLACEFRDGGFLPPERLQEQIDETLDALEYALGGPETKWGKLRAEAGHPAPFNLTYLEIGNENHGPKYRANYNRMAAAVRAKWPQVKLILNCGTGDWNPGHAEGVTDYDLADEHFYRDPEWFWDNTRRYDKTPRDRGPFKLYVGEYACNQRVGAGNHRAALSEAAFMMGMERNGDLVTMTSYAPLFFNVNRRDWPVNLIGFDSTICFGRSSYYVQQLFALHRPDRNVSVSFAPPTMPRETAQAGRLGLGTWNTAAEYRNLRVEVDGREAFRADFAKAGDWKPLAGRWSVTDGAYRQDEEGERKLTFLQGRTFSNFVLTVEARKVSGGEGFLIQFGGRDDRNYSQMNFGGWGNSAHALEEIRDGKQQPVTEQRRGRIEPGRWYTLKLVVAGDRVEGFLDGKSVAVLQRAPAAKFHAVAGIDRKANEMVIKAVNGEKNAAAMTLNLAGAKVGPGRVIRLQGDLEAENSVAAPESIAPREEPFALTGESTKLDLPPASLTIYRLPLK